MAGYDIALARRWRTFPHTQRLIHLFRCSWVCVRVSFNAISFDNNNLSPFHQCTFIIDTFANALWWCSFCLAACLRPAAMSMPSFRLQLYLMCVCVYLLWLMPHHRIHKRHVPLERLRCLTCAERATPWWVQPKKWQNNEYLWMRSIKMIHYF